jgi:antirestriction protein ArdC
MIVFYKTSTYEDNDGNEKTVPILRYYKVFASSQVDGYEAPTTTTKPVNPVDAIAAVDRFIANLHIETREASGRAFYSPSRDFVSMPPQNDFSKTSTSTATENYYSTFLHECTHATGHKSRCDRQLGGFFGDPEYAFEELVAELGAAMACASLGITDAVREDHCRYIRSWLKAIKDNPRAIFKASSLAQKAVDWMHAQQENQTAIAA